MKTKILTLAVTMLLCLNTMSAQEAPLQPAFLYKAEVDHVVDGDTISFDISLGFDVWVHDKSIRLLGVFAPETKSGTAEEKAKGKLVMDYVSSLLKDKKFVIIKTEKDKTDKYGRYLGTVWIGKDNLNQKILDFMKTSGMPQSGKGTK